MFMLGREKAKDEFDVLLSEGKSFQEVRRLMKERERARRDGVVKDEADRYAAMFQTSSAGVTKEAMLASNRGGPLALSEVKNLSAISLQRLPESKQPLDLLKRPLTDMELMEIAVRRCYVTGILDLKNCHLTEIPGKAMNTMMVQFGNITSINLNSNLLTTIPHSFAPLCPRLTELSVCGNKLKDVPRSILYLPRITELNLSENRIENVDILQAPLMEVLRFSNNYISSLDNMSYLRKLHTLHLDYCHMSFLTAHMKKLKALTYLDLSHNTLVSLALPSREATASKAQKKDGKGSGAVQSAEAKIGDTRVWQEVFDPFTGRKSYYCRQTKEARRTKPPGFDIQQAALAEKHRLQKEAVDRKAATLALAPVEIPEHLKDSASLPLMRSESSTLKEPPKVDPWMELVDDETGYTYFYNSWTGETAWEKPDPDNVVVKLKGWELVVDETSSDGAVYYRDLATNITQWEMPPEMDTLDALENLMTLNVGNNRLGALAPVRVRVPCPCCHSMPCCAARRACSSCPASPT